jgi:hypothetical protein
MEFRAADVVVDEIEIVVIPVQEMKSDIRTDSFRFAVVL